MAQRKNKDDGGQQTLNLILIGVGAWLLWEYVISPMIANAAVGSSAPNTNCFDANGNTIACPSGYPAGSVVGSATVTSTTQPVATPTTQNTTNTQNYLLARSAAITARTTTATALAARTAALQNEMALQSTRTSGSGQKPVVGMHGITPSWPAGGGPAFNHFIPGGGMTFGGANAFGSPAYGVMESLPKHGWIQ